MVGAGGQYLVFEDLQHVGLPLLVELEPQRAETLQDLERRREFGDLVVLREQARQHSTVRRTVRRDRQAGRQRLPQAPISSRARATSSIRCMFCVLIDFSSLNDLWRASSLSSVTWRARRFGRCHGGRRRRGHRLHAEHCTRGNLLAWHEGPTFLRLLPSRLPRPSPPPPTTIVAG